MRVLLNDWKLLVLFCATLGLAPFVPEPHLFGKIRWILGGAKGMELIDWGDFLMHALPFVLLLRYIIAQLIRMNKARGASKKYTDRRDSEAS
ncbi:MAG: hypothetical protein AB8F95_11570 [Bacteroidia bacterium]